MEMQQYNKNNYAIFTEKMCLLIFYSVPNSVIEDYDGNNIIYPDDDDVLTSEEDK